MDGRSDNVPMLLDLGQRNFIAHRFDHVEGGQQFPLVLISTLEAGSPTLAISEEQFAAMQSWPELEVLSLDDLLEVLLPGDENLDPQFDEAKMEAMIQSFKVSALVNRFPTEALDIAHIFYNSVTTVALYLPIADVVEMLYLRTTQMERYALTMFHANGSHLPLESDETLKGYTGYS